MADDSTKIDVTKEGIIDNDLAPGIAPLESPLGKDDPSEPVAEVHDLEFDAHMLGLPNNGIVQTSGDFIEGEAAVEGKSLADTIVNPIEAVSQVIEYPSTVFPTLEEAAEDEGLDLVGDVTPAPYAFLATLIGIPLWIWEGLTGTSPDKKELVEENPQLPPKVEK